MGLEPRSRRFDVLAGADSLTGEVHAAAESGLPRRIFGQEHLVMGVMDRIAHGEDPERLAGDRTHPESLRDGAGHPVVSEPR